MPETDHGLYTVVFCSRCESEKDKTDFLNGKIKPIYLKYLLAAFGSDMITSVYSIVDTAMVRQYHGSRNFAKRNALNKFLADRKIFIGINAAFFPDDIKVMLHFKVCQGDFS